jgi:hypothetical protein
MKNSLLVTRYLSIVVIIVIAITVNQNCTAVALPSGGAPSAALVDTPRFSIPFVANENNYICWAIYFGIHPQATKGLDPLLGENEVPPPPPTFDIRFGGPCGSGSCGQYLDFRPFTNPTQIDTFKVSFKADDVWGFPFIFSWANLSTYYNGSVRFKMDVSGSVFNIDMKAQNSYTILSLPPADPPLSLYYAYIIAEGPIPGATLPLVSTYGLGNGGFQAIVNTPGGVIASGSGTSAVTATTNVWFEYGPTKTYGTSTTPQSVPDGSHLNVSSPFDPTSLPMDTRIHFRAVAQNALGTFYGGDRVVSHGTPPAEVSSDTTKYRTATYRDWADAKDQKNKRKAVKPQNDKVEFEFSVMCDSPHIKRLEFEVSLGVIIDGAVFNPQSTPPSTISGRDAGGPKGYKKLICIWADTLSSGQKVTIHGYAFSKGILQTVKGYRWLRNISDTHPVVPAAQTINFTKNIPKFPMPNLDNVGEDIFGGVSQTPVVITVSSTDDPKGAHTVYHSKYSDVVKSLVKEGKAGDLYHTKAPHCLDTFDKNGGDIKKKQKSLPPDKHNNILFAEQLTLKLNIAASDSGIFPPGLGDLIFDDGGTGTLNGKTIRAIADSVDKYLGCNGDVANTEDSSYFFKLDSLINVAFAGPMDTTSWSGGKVFCSGVRMLMDVPYLHHNPAAVPRIDFARGPGMIYTQPSVFALRQNYPNPFNPTTTIEFTLAQDALVTLKIYNTLGQEVATLIHNELMDEGMQDVEFDASSLSSGVYYYRITAQEVKNGHSLFTSVKKMLLLK